MKPLWLSTLIGIGLVCAVLAVIPANTLSEDRLPVAHSVKTERPFRDAEKHDLQGFLGISMGDIAGKKLNDVVADETTVRVIVLANNTSAPNHIHLVYVARLLELNPTIEPMWTKDKTSGERKWDTSCDERLPYFAVLLESKNRRFTGLLFFGADKGKTVKVVSEAGVGVVRIVADEKKSHAESKTTTNAGAARPQGSPTTALTASAADADINTNSVLARAKAQSDIIVDCSVVDEGPLAHGSSIQKSYRVTCQLMYRAVVGLDLPKTIWIHYDSREYPKDLRSGREGEFHKGDRFIAFVDWHQKKKGREFRVVRLELAGKAETIKKELKLNTEQGGATNGSQPTFAAGSERLTGLPSPNNVFVVAVTPHSKDFKDYFTPESLLRALPKLVPADVLLPAGKKWQSGVIVLKDKTVLFWRTCGDWFIAVDRADGTSFYAMPKSGNRPIRSETDRMLSATGSHR
jgi:hypothetical protein